MKKYTIVAGVNGAGKTTLYQMDPDLRCDYRVNADEILVELGGDWRNASDILSAGKQAVEKLKTKLNEVYLHEKNKKAIIEIVADGNILFE